MHYCAEMRSAEITAKVAERLRGRLQSDYYSSSNLDLGFAFLKNFCGFRVILGFLSSMGKPGIPDKTATYLKNAAEYFLENLVKVNVNIWNL